MNFPIEIAVWDAQTTSSYLGVSKSSFLRRIAYLPNFPKAIRLPSGSGRTHPRWKASEVVNWVNENRLN